jgi:hypothetical protein
VVGPASGGAGVVLPAVRDPGDRRGAGAEADPGAHAGDRGPGADALGGGAPVSVRLRDGGLRLEEGLLLVRQDVLRGVHWHGVDVEDDLDDEDAWERSGRAVEEADIPTAIAVHAALTAERVDLARRRITVDRQVIETSHGLKLAPPKNPGAPPCSRPRHLGRRPRRPRRPPARGAAGRRVAVPLTQRALGSAVELPAQPVRPRRHDRRLAPTERRAMAVDVPLAAPRVRHLGPRAARRPRRRRVPASWTLHRPRHPRHLRLTRRRPLQPLLPSHRLRPAL